jgi:dihydrofolate synthase/folylpolyglutamate synthase
MKFGLRNMRTLLASVGNPERAFPSIHIAGTNGKGSTASFIASICMESGLKTGLYTSPHLVRFTERIRINGREVDERRVATYVSSLRPVIEQVRATFFEATTCIAFLCFAEECVDVAVVETGLGGRLDATNVLEPLVSVITNISLEHTDYLGTSIRSIAREKAGIIKRRVPLVTASIDRVALEVLRREAARKRARLFRAERLVEVIARGPEGKISVRAGSFRTRSFLPGVAGRYQYPNVALAVAALRILDSRLSSRLFMVRRNIEQGIRRVVRNTGLKGRLQMYRDGRLLLDVAHNAAGMKALAGELKILKPSPEAAVIGIMRDKDRSAMLQELGNVVPRIIVVAPGMKRAVPAARLFREGKKLGLPVEFGGTVRQGIKKAIRGGKKGWIVITGSHFVVGEALRHLGGENA